MTAHQLLHGGYDIVVVSYEFLESSYRGMRDFPKKVAEYKAKGGKAPRRPQSALFSDLWRKVRMPIKRLVLDEAQRVKNVKGARHIAAAALFYEAVLLLSGTFLDNQWYDVGGLIQFLRGHPFTTTKIFRTAFSDRDYQGVELVREHKIRLLQKFLMAFVIARPSSLLNLKGINRHYVLFNLSPSDAGKVEDETQKYEKAIRDQASNRNRQLREGSEGSTKDNPLGHAVRAQLYSLHSDLVHDFPEAEAELHEDEDDDEDDLLRRPDDEYDGNEALHRAQVHEAVRIIDYTDQQNEQYIRESRAKTLVRLDRDPDLVFNSERVQTILRLYDDILANWPGEKIVIFSVYLRFLDILFVAFKKRKGFEAHRYDGTVSDVGREVVRSQFQTGDPKVPLLITCGAGGVAINLTAASKLIQCEVWWNDNIARQAYSRIYRQGQEKPVHIFCLQGKNSTICQTILKVAKRKTIINQKLMGPLLRRHDEPPQIPEIPRDFGWERQQLLTDWRASPESEADEMDQVKEEDVEEDEEDVEEDEEDVEEEEEDVEEEEEEGVE